MNVKMLKEIFIHLFDRVGPRSISSGNLLKHNPYRHSITNFTKSIGIFYFKFSNIFYFSYFDIKVAL